MREGVYSRISSSGRGLGNFPEYDVIDGGKGRAETICRERAVNFLEPVHRPKLGILI